ncbi:hypothetical protein BB561_002612 [Smittium simulii]|uniref:Reverse transcriptase/retrotransposon-derived protein RNase H-like domain-containing protein n=1 Tax=Smittium simulii TaxID=133385 RepID=A0A2T9YQ27_9FUNG|nr:hypothetical protein BB561_002612 [Smittium simulii]
MFVLSTDASLYAVGVVLEQVSAEDKLRPIAYYSRILQKVARNDLNYKREALDSHGRMVDAPKKKEQQKQSANDYNENQRISYR